jgi:hypothetical protein
MAYTLNIPLATDLQSVSQSQILNNFTQLNTSFGIDHYPFTTAGANTGFHNQVTTPAIIGGVPTTTTNPIFYAYQITGPVGLIQYSGGPSGAVASPVTLRQSPSSPITISNSGTTNVLDFTGLARAICTLYAMDTGSGTGNRFSVTTIFWTGSTFTFSKLSGTSNLVAQNSGNIVQLLNNSGVSYSNVYWTLQMLRLS